MQIAVRIIVLTGLLFQSIFVLAQVNQFNTKLCNAADNSGLDRAISVYTLFTLDTRSLFSNLSGKLRTDEWSLDINEEMNWKFTLEPVDIIDNDTKFYTLSESGRQLMLNTAKVKTFKGIFSDGKNGYVRLTMDAGFFYGVINEGGKEYYIEPLRYYSDKSGNDQFVIYSAENAIDTRSKHICYREMEKEVTKHSTGADRLGGACYSVKLAILADYLMYKDQAHAGVSAVINHIVGVINNVQANYEYNGTNNFNDGIKFNISELVVSTCASCDPLSGQTNPSLLLGEFSAWVDQNGFNHPFHAAHFWSDRDFDGSAVGIAFQSSNLFCNTKARAIFQDWTGTAALLKIMASHEIGHNFNAIHDNTNTGYIMSPSISSSNITWSPISKTNVSSQIASQGPSCLDGCTPNVCSKVENLAVTDMNASSFTVSWSPSFSGSYLVKVREYGQISFILETVTSNSSITLSPPGFGICKKYDVFIYNNCGNSVLSTPQRIFIQGPVTQGCAEFTVNKTVVYPGTTIKFSDKSQNVSSWYWNFGNGQTSTLQNPTVTYSSSGVFNVSLTVNGSHTMSMPAAVKVLPYITPPFSLAQGGNFESNTNYFASEACEGIVNVWEFGTSSYVLVTQGNAWKTRLNSDIPQVTSKSALYTPKFNLNGYANYILQFDIGMEILYCNAPVAAQVQYSVDDGNSWSRLGNSPSFYNAGQGTACKIAGQVFSDSTGFTISGNYHHKSIDISFLAGQPNVIFRFVAGISSVFNSGYAVDGVLIDNVQLDALNPIALSINQSSLTVEKVQNKALLRWKAIETAGIERFVIEKSDNGLSFKEIGLLKPDDINKKDFTFTDEYLQAGINYYRIKSIDNEGNAEYSNIEYLNNVAADDIFINPNPVGNDGQANILWNGHKENIVFMLVFNALGNLVKSESIGILTEDVLHVEDLHEGIYYVRFVSKTGAFQSVKLVKH